MDIIGRGRLGTAFERRMAARGVSGAVFGRDDDLLALVDGAGPILVCTRNDDLDGVWSTVPPSRRGDLVFVQNGMLRPWLARHGTEGSGRGLIFAAVARVGDDFRPGGDSAFTGPNASAVVEFCRAIDLPAVALTATEFATLELEKLVWNCGFGLLSDAIGQPVGAVLADPGCDPLLRELIGVGARAFALEPDVDAMVERLRAYSASIANYRGALKEWRWRNGALVDAARAAGMEMPCHDSWLRRLPATSTRS